MEVATARVSALDNKEIQGNPPVVELNPRLGMYIF
jgi:hypothetical protein